MFAGQSGQTGQTGHVNWSDQSERLFQITNWTAPLSRSRRDDRNAYIECPIWSPDEEIMPSGNLESNFFARGVRGRSGWSADFRTTLDLRALTGSLPSSWF